MPMSGFFCHDDYYDRLLRLSDEEVGHLFRQLMLFHAGRFDEMTNFVGAEGIAYDFIVSDIERMEKKQSETSETNRINGLKGGRPRKQTEPKETEENRNKPNETEQNRTKPYKDKEIDKDIYIDDDTNARASLIDEDEARAIQQEQDCVLDAAENAGFRCSPTERSNLIRIYAANGLEKVLSGIASCVKHGAPNLAYLEACMKDEPKKPRASPGKIISAQQYTQRDYSDEQADAMHRMIEQYGGAAK